jgi:hypothetical protein
LIEIIIIANRNQPLAIQSLSARNKIDVDIVGNGVNGVPSPKKRTEKRNNNKKNEEITFIIVHTPSQGKGIAKATATRPVDDR